MVPRIVAEDRAPLRNGTGITITPDLTFAEVERADIVIVGDLGIAFDEETRGRWPAAVAWLRAQHAAGRAGLLRLHRLADARGGGAARRRGGDLPLGGDRGDAQPLSGASACAPRGCWCRRAPSTGW